MNKELYAEFILGNVKYELIKLTFEEFGKKTDGLFHRKGIPAYYTDDGRYWPLLSFDIINSNFSLNFYSIPTQKPHRDD